jgi:hypothetical protein
MRLNVIAAVAAVAAVCLTALPAVAQEGEGQYAADLRRMISETAGGTCPTDLMAGGLLTACQQQLPQMSAGLSSLGAIQSVTFARAEDTPQGRVETYTVTFANGVP